MPAGPCLRMACAPVAPRQQAPAPAAPPAEVQQLVDLLRKPEVQAWLAKGAPAAAPQAARSRRAPREEIRAARPTSPATSASGSPATRSHVAGIRDGAAADPGRAGADRPETRRRDPGQGLLADPPLRRRPAGARLWQSSRPTGAARAAGASTCWRCRSTRSSSGSRWSGQRFGYNLLWLLSFAVGSLGALLLFSWPPYLKTILSAIFLIIIVALLWGALARFLLSPNNRQAARLPDRRRLGAALDPLERRSCWAGSSAAGWPCRCCRTSTWTGRCGCRSPTRSGSSCSCWPWSRCGGGRRWPSADAAQRDRARNITLAVSVLFAALLAAVGVRHDQGLLAARWWPPACPPRSASSTARSTMS